MSNDERIEQSQRKTQDEQILQVNDARWRRGRLEVMYSM